MTTLVFMAEDLVALVNHVKSCIGEVVSSQELLPIFNVLKELKLACDSSEYKNPESFVENRSLRTSSNKVIIYRRMQGRECIAIDFQAANADVQDALKGTADHFISDNESYFVELGRKIVGIEVNAADSA